MSEDFDNHGGIFDGGDECDRAPTGGTGCHVNLEHAFEQLRPAQAGSRGGRRGLTVRLSGSRQLVGCAGDNLSPEGRVRRKHAMKPNEMEPWPWDEGREALQKCQRRHHEMGGFIAVWRFELQDDLAGPGAAQPFVAKGWARDVATGAFEGVPLRRAAVRVGMQTQALGADTAWVSQRRLARGGGL